MEIRQIVYILYYLIIQKKRVIYGSTKTVKNDMFYLECKHCGRIFPIGSICEFMEELGNENFDSEVLDWCEDCLDEKYEREDRYLKMLAQAKEVDKRKNSLNS
ncbi:MAG: hypothetical protein MR028_03015 [Ligilactobacillus agilis]|nr:hypothetical protein [Ligilactobacillus agilis]